VLSPEFHKGGDDEGGEEVDDSSENETEVAATVEGELNNVTSICMVFDSARLYVMKLRNQSEMEQWLASIGACVAGNGSSKEESTEEKANRVHKIMRTSMYSAALYGKAGVVEQVNELIGAIQAQCVHLLFFCIQRKLTPTSFRPWSVY
jgi:hypothetical protein